MKPGRNRFGLESQSPGAYARRRDWEPVDLCDAFDPARRRTRAHRDDPLSDDDQPIEAVALHETEDL